MLAFLLFIYVTQSFIKFYTPPKKKKIMANSTFARLSASFAFLDMSMCLPVKRFIQDQQPISDLDAKNTGQCRKCRYNV